MSWPPKRTFRGIPRAGVVALTSCMALVLGCGSNRFSESSEGRPFPGTERWMKVDQRPDVTNALGVQAVSLAARLGDELHHPSVVVLDDGSLELFYASAFNAGIGRTRAAAGSYAWEPARIVLRARAAWEAGVVSAPSVLERNGRYELWYAGGDGVGIGRAVSEDGIAWSRDPVDPVMVPTETWQQGGIHAPAVAESIDGDGRLWMAFEAGDGEAIGLASSIDGVHWIVADGDPSTASFDPILRRGTAGSWDEARVAAPSLRLERTETGRTVYRLWFEGMAQNDFSIGEAAAYDGERWQESPLNPALNEVAPLSLAIPADEREPWVQGDVGSRTLFFVAQDLNPPQQGIGIALDHTP